MSAPWTQDDDGFIHAPDGTVYDGGASLGLLKDKQDRIEHLEGLLREAFDHPGYEAATGRKARGHALISDEARAFLARIDGALHAPGCGCTGCEVASRATSKRKAGAR